MISINSCESSIKNKNFPRKKNKKRKILWATTWLLEFSVNNSALCFWRHYTIVSLESMHSASNLDDILFMYQNDELNSEGKTRFQIKALNNYSTFVRLLPDSRVKLSNSNILGKQGQYFWYDPYQLYCSVHMWGEELYTQMGFPCRGFVKK